MNKKIVVIVLIFVALVVVATWGALSLFKSEPNLIQGEVDANSVKVSSKLAGRIENLYVAKGDIVKQGAPIFTLSTPEVSAKLKQAQAARSAASAQYEKAEAGARRQTIESALTMWEKAKAGLELAQKSYNRIKNLYESGVVPAQKYDEVAAQLKSMQNTEKAARLQYELAVEGAQKEDKDAARSLVDKADGAIDEVKSYLVDSEQFAPINGMISSVIAEQGELVGSGYPVVTILDTDNLWISFNVKETMLPKFKMGVTFPAYFPALNRTIELKVTDIAVQAEYATWTATRSKGSFDIRTFEVVARPVVAVEGMRVGMTAVVDMDKLN